MFRLQFWAAESRMAIWVLRGSLFYAVLEHGDFLTRDTSQGKVATRLRYGRIFNKLFAANLLKNLQVKEFRKSVKIWRSHHCQFGLSLGYRQAMT